MSFSFFEMASFGSRPALLFEFRRGPIVYRYTSADRPLTVGGNVYTARPMACGAIRYSGEAQSDELTITAPANLPLVEQFTAVPPQDRVQVSVMRYHEGADPVVRFSGKVNRVVRKSRSRADVVCDSYVAGLQQNGARLVWQRQCPHALYSLDCGVSKAAHAVTASVFDIIGNTINAFGLNAVPSGRLTAGFIEWTTPDGFPARRGISFHSDLSLVLLGGAKGIEVGTVIVAYPGCARTPDACQSFNNGPNYGGIRHLPGKSPFDGSPVF